MDTDSPDWLARSLEFIDGAQARLISLEQSLTYRNLIEGVPNARINELFHLTGARRPRSETAPNRVLIPPRTRLADPPFEFMGQPVEYLPAIACVAYFRAPELGDPEVVWELEIAWFQDQFAMPVDPEVLSAIRAIEWYKTASRHEI